MLDEVRSAVQVLASAIGDPRRGLPEDVFLFISRITPLINVDLLIQDEAHRTLLTWRDDDFFGSGWHVPGGIIRYNEVIADRIHACARDELGIQVSFDPTPALVSETTREQSERGHFISLLYHCRLLTPPDEGRRTCSIPPGPGRWQWHVGCPSDLLSVQSLYARFL
jgi:ADP-ribose pyrophosphatase YjhB (NUDIX family)